MLSRSIIRVEHKNIVLILKSVSASDIRKMFLGLTDSAKGLLSGGVPAGTNKALTNSEGRDRFCTRGNIANRGPCPGLNALASQGYLFVIDEADLPLTPTHAHNPHNGKHITLSCVEEALTTALHMDKALETAITNSLHSLLRIDGTFDLVLMRQHNVFEHDASFTRLDFREGDNYSFQPAVFRKLLDHANGGPFTISSLARTYVRRNK